MRHSLAVLALLTLTACSSIDEKDDTKNLSAGEIYAQAHEAIEDGRYEQAVKRLEKLQSRFPYGSYAQQAQMEIAYAYYKQGEPAPALSAIDRFVKVYPNNPNIDYMLYLKGLINFDETLNSAGVKYFNQDPGERDPQSLRESFDSFKELATRYPDSHYSVDARTRLQYLINTLAASDINTANYYLRRGAFQAAVNRAQSVIVNFPESPQSRNALEIMVKAYEGMGLVTLRDDTQKILDVNIAKDGVRPSKRPSAPWWQFWNG
jgi:outer membrane protein assembly factor BamD